MFNLKWIFEQKKTVIKQNLILTKMHGKPERHFATKLDATRGQPIKLFTVVMNEFY
jgi:hypothetical protein